MRSKNIKRSKVEEEKIRIKGRTVIYRIERSRDRKVERVAMRIKSVRKVKGEEMIKEFEKKYGCLRIFERYIKENRGDYIALMNCACGKNW